MEYLWHDGAGIDHRSFDQGRRHRYDDYGSRTFLPPPHPARRFGQEMIRLRRKGVASNEIRSRSYTRCRLRFCRGHPDDPDPRLAHQSGRRFRHTDLSDEKPRRPSGCWMSPCDLYAGLDPQRLDQRPPENRSLSRDMWIDDPPAGPGLGPGRKRDFDGAPQDKRKTRAQIDKLKPRSLNGFRIGESVSATIPVRNYCFPAALNFSNCLVNSATYSALSLTSPIAFSSAAIASAVLPLTNSAKA